MLTRGAPLRSPAVDIQLQDAAWEGARLTLLDGKAEAKVAALAPGANVTHTYTLRAHAPGVTLGKPAMAKYRDATRKTTQARPTPAQRSRCRVMPLSLAARVSRTHARHFPKRRRRTRSWCRAR